MPAGLCLSKTSTQTAGLELTLVTLLHFNIERALEQILPGKEPQKQCLAKQHWDVEQQSFPVLSYQFSGRLNQPVVCF